jgi:hypothetical protein
VRIAQAAARREILAVGLPCFAVLALLLYRISLAPAWVGDFYDDGGYFLMSRNMWLHGAPFLNQHGPNVWSTTWAPGLPIVLSPLAGLGLSAGVVAERLALALVATAWIAFSYLWMRRTVRLTKAWAAVAATCLATLPVLATLGSAILSDVAAAAALWVGIVLVRAGRVGRGTAAFALAAAFRVVDIALLAVIPVWLLLTGRRRAALAASSIGCIAVGVLGVFWLFHGPSGYLIQIRRRNPIDPNSGTIGLDELPHRVLTSLKKIAFDSRAFPAGPFESAHLIAYAHPALAVFSVALLLCAAAGIWRRRLVFEALVALVTLAVVSLWPSDPRRFVLPLAPLVVGAAAVPFAESRRRLAPIAAAGAAAVALCGNLYEYWVVTPSRASSRQRVEAARAAYDWLHDHVSDGATVIASNDIQAFLYSEHSVATGDSSFRPGHTYVIAVLGPDKPRSQDSARRLLRGYEGTVVFANRYATILRAQTRGS